MSETLDMEQSESRPLLFISHLHEDKQIADVIRDFFSARSAGQVDVFQSSSAQGEAPRAGEDLSTQLVEWLWRAGVVILIYTSPNRDWSYPMWECGIAIKPPSPPDTRVIVFQSGESYPAVFQNAVRVNLRTFENIQKFVNDFLTDPGFFPRYGRAVTAFPPRSSEVERAAQELYDDLRQVLPSHDGEGVEEWPPYPQLTLEVSREGVGKINRDERQREQTAIDVVLDSPIIGSDSEARRLFGRAKAIPLNTKLADLVAAWQARYPQAEPVWVDALSEQVSAAALGLFPNLRWQLMRGLDRNDGTWYAPVVNRVRTIVATGAMQFDVFFDKFELDEDGKSVKVGIPTQ